MSDLESLLLQAIDSNDVDTLRRIVSTTPAIANAPVDNDLPLHRALLRRSWQCVDLLLTAGADVHARDEKCDRRTALHVAALESNVAVVVQLIDRGAVIDALDADDCTPLHNAVWADEVGVAKLLLERGANVDARSRSGMTPICTVESAAMVTLLCNAYNCDLAPLETCGWDVVYRSEFNARGALTALLAFNALQYIVNMDTHIRDLLFEYKHSAALLYAAGAEPYGWRSPSSLQSQIADAKRSIYDFRVSLVRERTFAISVGLHSLDLPAFVSLCIVDHMCYAMVDVVRMHFKWQIITHIKHFHRHCCDNL